MIAAVVAALVAITYAAPLGAQPANVRGLDELLQSAVSIPGIPGLAVAAVRDDAVVYQNAFGLADMDTGRRVNSDSLFYIASMSKAFLATTAAILQSRAELDFNQTLGAALPGVVLHEGLSPSAITIRDLLTMSHGIAPEGPASFRAAYSGDFANQSLIDLLRFHPPSRTGKSFEYGNLGYNILGLVIEAKVKEGWKDVVHREVLAPLAMTTTTAYLSRADRERLAMPHRLTTVGTARAPLKKRDENMHAAGGHLTTVGDLARFLEAHLNAGRVDGKQVLPADAVAATQRKAIDQNRRARSVRRTGWGVGWDIGNFDGDVILQRNGGFIGYQSVLALLPGKRTGVAVLTNGNSSAAADAVMACVLNVITVRADAEALCRTDLAYVRKDIEAMQPFIAPAAPTTSKPRRALREYTGTYVNAEWGTFVVTAPAGALRIRFGVLESDAVADGADTDRFRADLEDLTTVTFSFDGGGTATTLIWRDLIFERVIR